LKSYNRREVEVVTAEEDDKTGSCAFVILYGSIEEKSLKEFAIV